MSNWAVIGPEPGGRESHKAWIAQQAAAPRDQHWLWKPRTHTGDGSELALSDVAEVASSRLATMIGLPAAECLYAARSGVRGAISRNVTPSGHDLHDGAAYLQEVVTPLRGLPSPPEVPGGRIRSDIGYTLESAMAALGEMSGPPGFVDLHASQVFAGFLVLDALVANTDRHPRNWGVLEDRRAGTRAIAPTFDHGTALGSGLTEENRAVRDAAAFARRGRANPFSPPKQSLVGLALRAVDLSDARFWVDRVAGLDAESFSTALEAPQGTLSVVAATFIETLLEENKRRLCGADAD